MDHERWRPVRRLCNFSLDLLLAGRFLGRCAPSRFAACGAHPVGASDYLLLTAVFRQVPPAADDLAVDIGCGTGRVLAWWDRFSRLRRIIGLEIDPDLAATTARRFADRPRIRVVHRDASRELPREGSLFFLYNSLDRNATIRLEVLLRHLPTARTIRLVYFNPAWAELFSLRHWWRQEIDLKFWGKASGACLLFVRKTPSETMAESSSGQG